MNDICANRRVSRASRAFFPVCRCTAARQTACCCCYTITAVLRSIHRGAHTAEALKAMIVYVLSKSRKRKKRERYVHVRRVSDTAAGAAAVPSNNLKQKNNGEQGGTRRTQEKSRKITYHFVLKHKELFEKN